MYNGKIYQLQTPQKIYAGENSIENIKNIIEGLGIKKATIVTDKAIWETGLIRRAKAILEESGVHVSMIKDVPSEPKIAEVERILNLSKALDTQLLIAIGGGSVMDVTKIIAVLMENDCPVRELIGANKVLKKGIPTLMIPTTSGTGAEATPNAIVTIPEEELKVGIVSDTFIADYVILDPLMTLKLPKTITASTGMDALAHALECYISNKANPFSDTFALKAIRLICSSIRIAYNEGDNVKARHDMLLGSFMAGVCIATSGTTAVHALAYPLGGKYGIAHGVSNAMLLAPVMKFNMDVIEDKLVDVAVAMEINVDGLLPSQAAEKVIENLFSLVEDLNIPTNLKEFGIGNDDIELLVEGASKVTRLLNNNPKSMTKDDMRKIYEKLF